MQAIHPRDLQLALGLARIKRVNQLFQSLTLLQGSRPALTHRHKWLAQAKIVGKAGLSKQTRTLAAAHASLSVLWVLTAAAGTSYGQSVNGQTPLRKAAVRNDCHVMQLPLQAGMQVDPGRRQAQRSGLQVGQLVHFVLVHLHQTMWLLSHGVRAQAHRSARQQSQLIDGTHASLDDQRLFVAQSIVTQDEAVHGAKARNR